MLSGVRPLKSVPKGSPEATSTGVDAPTTAVIVSPAAAKKAEDSSLRLVEQAQTVSNLFIAGMHDAGDRNRRYLAFPSTFA